MVKRPLESHRQHEPLDVMAQEPISVSLSITLPAPSIAPAKSPHTYLGIAYNMLPGVKVLAAASPLPALPLALVSAHVLECALKAYLSKSGDDSQVKKPDIRHDLDALWALAHSQGLSVPQQPPGWVSSLSHLHSAPYYLRYSTGVHGLVTPPPEPMATELGALVELVRTQL